MSKRKPGHVSTNPRTAMQVTRGAGKMLNYRRKSLMQQEDRRHKELEQAFAIFDRNRDGRISKDEVRNVLMETGVSFTAGQLETFMKKLDTNGDGSVDYSDFCTMMQDLVSSTVSMEGSMKAAFANIDTDGDGKIDRSELRIAVMHLGEDMREKEAEEVIRTVDDNGDARIDYEEFVRLMLMLNITPASK